MRGFQFALLLGGLAAGICSPAQQTESLPQTAPVAPTAIPAVSYVGLTVAEIKLLSSPPIADDKFLPLLSQHVGEPLDRDKLRRSVQALYDTGRFSRVQVQADRTPGGKVSLSIALTQRYFVGALSATGVPKPPPTRNQLLDSTKLSLGEPLDPQKVTRGVADMKLNLASNGFHQSAVSTRESPHPESLQMDENFHIVAGRRATFGTVDVTGDSGHTGPEVQRFAKLRPGDHVTNERVRGALRNLRKRYQKENRLEAQLSITRKDFHPETNSEDYLLNVERGPLVTIRVEGARISRRLIKRYVPVYEENSVDDDLLNEGNRNLTDYFQTRGLFDVQVGFRRETAANGAQQIVYEVNKGKLHKLVAIAFQGNRYFDSDLLRERLTIQTSSLVLRHGRFSQSLLGRDAQSIQELYKSNGFQQANVRGEAQDDYAGVEGNMKVIFHVEEGQQTRIASLKIEGNRAISSPELLGLLNSGEGQLFSETNVAADRDTILNYYFNLGFPNVQFEAAENQVSANPPRMEVVYKIQEGARVFVDHVFVSGLNFTKPATVQREVQIAPGDPLNQSAILDTQRRLYDLGLFNQVNVAVQDPDGDFAWKNVLVQVQEAKRYTFGYGVGLEVQTGSEPGTKNPRGRTGVSPRVSFDVTRINLGGRDHTLVFKSRYGRLQQRFLLSYESPHLLNRNNWNLIFTGFYDTTRDVRTFTAERLEGSVQLEQKITKPTTLLYAFTYRRVKVDPRTLAIDPNQIPLLSKPVRVGMPSLTAIRDTRDDALDAHKGNYSTLDTGVAAGFFGSESTFGRVLVTNSTYKELRKKKWVIARSTRIGVENPFGSSSFIPLPERFYAGGANSDRAFSINQAGPRDLQTGFPLGGEALFVNQLELRFTPFQLPLVGNSISPVLFHDAGNVFSSASDIFPSMFRVGQRNRQQCQTTSGNSPCDFNYFSHAIGIGLRYRTPIAPVRFDLGYNLNPPTFPIRSEARFQTLRHFNFYFSLGQTF